MGCRIRLDQYRPDGAERLARAVYARRGELGLTRIKIKHPSVGTLYSIEFQRKNCYDSALLTVLERAMHWERGSVERILRGENPIPLGDQQQAREQVRAAETHESTARQLQEQTSRRALYRLMCTMGKMYGPEMILEVTADVLTELQTPKRG